MKKTTVSHNGVRYELDETTSNITLRYSDRDRGWSEHIVGKKAASLFDSGDDLTFYARDIELSLDYSEAHKLFILLGLYYNREKQHN